MARGDCRNKIVSVFLDNAPLPKPFKIQGCYGEVAKLKATTTIDLPVKYQWSLDHILPTGLLLSDRDTLDYVFDDESHFILLVVTGQECAIQTVIKARGEKCVDYCPIFCQSEYVDIPAGVAYGLVDDNDTFYPLTTNGILECANLSKENGKTLGYIRETIENAVPCESISLAVSFKYLYSHPNCMRLTIENSPIKFRHIKVGNIFYPFNIVQC
jgi:hypothetical protein